MTSTTRTGTATPTPPGPPRGLRTALIATGSAALVVVVGIAVGDAVVGPDRVDASRDSVVAEPFDRLMIDAGAADVTVRYGNVVRPRIDFAAGDTGLTETHAVDDGRLVIELRGRGWRPFDLSYGTTRGATLDVLLPEVDMTYTALELTTTAGDISASGPFADTALTTATGDILITGVTEDLVLDTTAGDIDARDVDTVGEVRSTSTAGSTRLLLDSAPSAMTVETTAGDQLIRIPAGDYDIQTRTLVGEASNGLGSDPGSTYRYRFSSTMGDITVEQR